MQCLECKYAGNEITPKHPYHVGLCFQTAFVKALSVMSEQLTKEKAIFKAEGRK